MPANLAQILINNLQDRKVRLLDRRKRNKICATRVNSRDCLQSIPLHVKTAREVLSTVLEVAWKHTSRTKLSMMDLSYRLLRTLIITMTPLQAGPAVRK